MPRRTEVTNIRLTDTLEIEGIREGEPAPRSAPRRRTVERRDRRRGVGLLILATAAFVPMLASRPGRLILDTHDGLHLDPAGTLATAASRWDPIGALGMFADKTYDYTFPMSQFFWFGDRIGLPMWLTHRLWVGLLLFAAGTGVVFLLRTMNWTEQSWLLAALAYQCSPYVLLYAGSRSTVLLAWAALPWLIAFTTRSLVETGWRSPAWCAVIVALVGSGNVPATIYVALACLTWFLYATVATKDVGWRDALMPFGRIASLCTIVSVWWLTSLLVDPSAAFADLRASARLDSVQEATPVSEVVRGLGSWRLYTLDESNAIAAGIDLQRSPWLIAAGFALPAIAMATMVRIRFPYRLYFVTLFTLGVVLSTGTYARGEGEPFSRGMRSLVDHGAGALLSPSNRALPLFWLAVSVSVGVGVHRFGQLFPRAADIARFGVVSLIVVGALPLFRGAALDGARAIPDGIPEYWQEAADYVNAIDSSNNILELPALARTTYTWGSPNQPISYTLFDRPVGLVDPGSPPSAATATLLRELDQRIQRAELTSRQLSTVARLLAVDTIVVRADGIDDAGRVDNVRALVEDASSESPREFGTMPDGTAAVSVYRVDGGPDRHSTIAADRLTVMSGSAAGVLDLIRADVVDEELPLVVDDADLQEDDLVGSVPDDAPVALTDSARPLVTDHYLASDAGVPDERGRTTIEWAGVAGISARLAGGDELIDPSHRLMLAFDDEPTTSWLTGAGSAQVDATIDVLLETPVRADSIRIAQPGAEVPARRITSVDLRFDPRDDPITVPLDATSWTADGQTVSFQERTFSWLRIVVTGVGPGDAALPVGFSAVEVDGVHPTEVLRLPTGQLDGTDMSSHPLVVSMTRWRGETLSGPPLETRFHRRFAVAGGRDQLFVRADVRGDPGPACRTDLVTIDGEPIGLQVDSGQESKPSNAVFTVQLCGAASIGLQATDSESSEIEEASLHEVSTKDPRENPRGIVVERVVLHEAEREPTDLAVLGPTELSLFGQTSATVTIPDASTPLWLVQAASADSGWAATEDDGSLSAPRLVNGFASGWPITKADGEPHTVAIRYAPKRAIDIAIIVSAVGFAMVLALALRPHRSSGQLPSPPIDPRRYVHPLVVVIVSLGVFGLAAGPVPGIIAGLTALLLEQRPHLFNRVAWLPSLLLLGAGVGRAVWQVVEAPAIGPTWPAQAPLVDGIMWVAISMAVAMALGNTDYRPAVRPPIRSRR